MGLARYLKWRSLDHRSSIPAFEIRAGATVGPPPAGTHDHGGIIVSIGADLKSSQRRCSQPAAPTPL
jgi:hypothetical protein